MSVLSAILERKRAELVRRARHRERIERLLADAPPPPPFDLTQLRRRGALPRLIAEIKHRSPSAGVLRARRAGELAAIAEGYEQAGAAAISVLADGPGFGGSILDVRRAARAVSRPILFKEFVLDELQLDLARLAGARLILLIVRALEPAALSRLIRGCEARGLVPVVEAADLAELAIAVDTGAAIVGMNARDLRSFAVDPQGAQEALERVPADRIAVYMSGIENGTDLARVGQGRADAALLGSATMRAPDPGRRLAEIVAEARKLDRGAALG